MGDQYGLSNVRAFGAVGDGVADDRVAIQAAIDGGVVVYIPAGTYRVSGGFVTNKSITIIGQGSASRIRMTGTTGIAALFWLGGAVANSTPNPGYAGTVYNLGVAPLAAGTITYTFISTAGLAVGDTLFLALGIDPYDGGQHFLRQWNVVQAINGNQVTMRFPLSEAVGAAGAPVFESSPTFHEAVKFTYPADGITLANLSIEQTAGAASADVVSVMRSRHVHIHDIFMPNVTGRIVVGECENVVVEHVYAERVSGELGFVTFYGSRNVSLRNCRALIAGYGIYFENQVRNFSIERVILGGDGLDKGIHPYVKVTGGSLRGEIRGLEITKGVTADALAAPALIVDQASEVITENVVLPA